VFYICLLSKQFCIVMDRDVILYVFVSGEMHAQSLMARAGNVVI